MKPKTTYLVLLVAGTVIPYWEFIHWLAEHGLDARLLFQQLFANRISSFFALDVIISALALLCFIAMENAGRRIRGSWLAVLATLFVGVSCGLPLFLYMLEQRKAATTAS
jgi:hypothetical protein